MDVFINSKKVSLDKSASLQELLEINGINSGNYAIAVNRKFVPRGQYVRTMINEGDQVEIVTPMQGG